MVTKIFEDIYREHRWGGESPSGPGSSRDQAQRIGAMIAGICRDYQVKSVLDVGCGDLNWLRAVTFPAGLPDYTGIDVVPELIEELQKEIPFGRFLCADVTEHEIQLPQVDLILCRDVLMHLSLGRALHTLRTFIGSRSTYLLATTFMSGENVMIHDGQWFPINLEQPPFSLGIPIEIMPDWYPNENYQANKVLALWQLNT